MPFKKEGVGKIEKKNNYFHIKKHQKEIQETSSTGYLSGPDGNRGWSKISYGKP